MKPKYKDATMQRVYDTMLALAGDTTSELYHNGEPRRGAGHRAAFWDGFSGEFTFTGPKRSAHVVPGTPSAACFMAGRAFAKRPKKLEPRFAVQVETIMFSDVPTSEVLSILGRLRLNQDTAAVKLGELAVKSTVQFGPVHVERWK